MNNSAKKNVLVTGVSRGVGLEICRVLLEKKAYFVYGISRSDSTNLENLREKFSDRIVWTSFDLLNVENIPTLFKEFIGFKTPLHGVVNNAAIAYDDIVTNINVRELKRMFEINVIAPMVLTKYAIRHMLLHGNKGSLVHISSISAHTGYKGLAMYASSKGALEAFSKSVSREWGVKGIRSNVVVPGFMETEMSKSLSDDQRNAIYRRTALKRATEVASVAHTVEFLLSDYSSSITGECVFVDSGTI